MALNVGDAVMTFLGDSTDLEAAITRIANQAETSMAAAAGSVDQFTDALSSIEPVIANSRHDVDAWNETVMDAMGKAKEAVQGVTDKFVGFNDVLDKSLQEWDGLTPRVNQFSQSAQKAGGAMQYSFMQARGGIMLLGEEVGIHLPRALTTLLAHIPIVGAAFSTMLPLIGVVAAIGIIGELIEKHEKLAIAQRHEKEETEELAIKQQDMVIGLKNANLALEDQIQKLQGRPETNQLAIALNDVRIKADELARSFDADFTKMDAILEQQGGIWNNLKQSALAALAALTPELQLAGWQKSTQEQVAGNYLVQKSIEQVTLAEDKLHQAQRKLADQDPAKNLEAWKAAAGAVAIAAGAVQATSDAAAAAVRQVNPDAHELITSLTKGAIDAKAEWQSMAEKITATGLELRKVHQEMANASAEKQVTAAKEAYEAQLSAIEKWKAEQHAAYESGKIDAAAWSVAELQATDAAAIAHENYLAKLVALYTRAGETEKAHAAAEELSTLRTKDAAKETDALATAMQKQREEMVRVRNEASGWGAWQKSVAEGFEKAGKATEELTRADEELLKAQSKLKEDTLAQHFKDQEEAITKLAAMHLITEEQKDDRLKLLEQQQSNAAIAILTDQLAKEKAVLDAAQAKITQASGGNPLFTAAQLADLQKNLHSAESAVSTAQAEMDRLHKVATSNPLFTDAELADFKKKLAEAEDAYHQAQAKLEAAQAQMKAASGNPFFTDAQIAELQANLKKAETAVTNTEAQIVQTKEKFNKESEADDKSHYGRALLTAMAYGNELLAEQLRQNHAALLAAQSEAAQAKARGQNTTAIEKEIQALKQNEQALEKEANGGKIVTAEKQKFVQQAILAAQAELAEAKARGQNTTAIEQEIVQLQKLQKLQQQQTQQMPQAKTALDGFRMAWQQLGQMMKNVQSEMSNAYATAIMGALESGKSIGAALEAATKQVLESLAEQALAKSIFYTAQGIADSVWNPAFAAADFAAAAEFALVAGAAGAVGLAMPGGGSGSGAQQQPPTPGQPSTSLGSGGGGGSTQTVGVTKLAEGGVVSKPTMIAPNVMAGDSQAGGAAEEAILPLSDPTAMRQIASAIAPGIPPVSATEQNAFDPQAIQRMMEAISALTGTRNASQEFKFAEPSTAEAPGFQFAGSTDTERRGFVSSASTVGQALGLDFAPGTPAATPAFADRAEASKSETPAFSSAEPSASEKLPVLPGGSPSQSAAAQFAAAAPSSESPEREFPAPIAASATEKQGFVSPPAASVSEKPGFVSSAGTVGEALGFAPRAESTPGEKSPDVVAESSEPATHSFAFGESAENQPARTFERSTAADTTARTQAIVPGSPAPTVGEALGITRSEASGSEKPGFSPGGTASPSEKAGFNFAPAVPSTREAAGFTSGEPAPGEKSSFQSAQPSESEKALFLGAQPSISPKPGFETPTASPTVGEALGFKFDTPYPGDKPVYSSGQPSDPAKPGFSLATPSAADQRDFAAASAPTVGEALGFNFSAPRASYEGLGFTSGQSSSSSNPGFSSGVQSPHETPEINRAPSSAGSRPAFDFSAPSLPREMPDMESLAANFGGLLSQPTLRAASNAQVPAAAVSAGVSATPMDLEARMEKFAAKIGSQVAPEGASSAGGDTHIHNNIKGLLDTGNLKKIIKKTNRLVNNRQATVKSTSTQRINRRSN